MNEGFGGDVCDVGIESFGGDGCDVGFDSATHPALRAPLSERGCRGSGLDVSRIV